MGKAAWLRRFCEANGGAVSVETPLRLSEEGKRRDQLCVDGTLAHHFLLKRGGVGQCRYCGIRRHWHKEGGIKRGVDVQQVKWEKGWERAGYRAGWLTGGVDYSKVGHGLHHPESKRES